MSFSFIIPCEEDRKNLLFNTIETYIKFGLSKGCEFIIISRTIKELSLQGVNIKLISYEHSGDCFNPSLALNLGVKNSNNTSVIITCPEVRPITNVLNQLEPLIGQNIICQVFDLKENGERLMSLVNSKFRGETPAMYFLAMFNKEDIYKINGWDLEFMKGYAWEDTDFGDRWFRAKLPFIVRDDIQGEHQWHLRGTTNQYFTLNKLIYEQNKHNNIIKCNRGIENV